MHFLSQPLIYLALQHFKNIDLTNLEECDWFFQTFGPGNVANGTDRSHERFNDYEELLNLLHDFNKERYERIHKGTPFFFLSWLAFDLRNHEKALYYLDAAISEDVKNFGADWIDMPGAQFLKLTTGPHVGARVILYIRDELRKEIERFVSVSNLTSFSLDDLVSKFVADLIQKPTTRTIVSAFYIFVLEHAERATELRLKSTEGSSIGPIISHLFNGALVFESVLKNLYPLKDDGTPVMTLGDIFKTGAFKGEFAQNLQTKAESLQEVLDAAQNNELATALSTTARIRNTTGHNLVWDNIFQDQAHYEALWSQVVNALLYIIEKKFIR
jgi:hypothetical protein